MTGFERRVPIETPAGEVVGEVRWNLGTALERVGDVYLPARLDATLFGGRDLPRVELAMEIRDGIPAMTSVELASGSENPQIIRRHLALAADRLTLWNELLVDAAAQDVPDAPPGSPSWADKGTVRRSVDAARLRTRRRLTPEFLRQVAAIYRANVSGEPVAAIAEHYGVPQRTAARWVQMCRTDEYALLPKTTRGQRKA